MLLVHGNGPDLDVELRVDTVKWKFGDPASSANTASGLGEPYPTPSSVAHTYERKGSYTVTADLVIAGRFWYEELFDALPPSTRTVTLRHDVVEIRSLLHAAVVGSAFVGGVRFEVHLLRGRHDVADVPFDLFQRIGQLDARQCGIELELYADEHLLRAQLLSAHVEHLDDPAVALDDATRTRPRRAVSRPHR